MNEIEKKEIEEMARIIGASCDNKSMDYCNKVVDCDICRTIDLYNAGYRNVKDKVVLSKEEWEVLHNDYAKSLYNARQDERKKMQEENGQLRLENNDLEAENDKLKEELKQASELKAETIKLAKIETAKEIIAKIQGLGTYHTEFDWNDYLQIDVDDLYKLTKEYGVEVE